MKRTTRHRRRFANGKYMSREQSQVWTKAKQTFWLTVAGVVLVLPAYWHITIPTDPTIAYAKEPMVIPVPTQVFETGFSRVLAESEDVGVGRAEPTPTPVVSTPTPTPVVKKAIKKGKPATQEEKKSVEAYIKKVFGEHGDVAFAVAQVEGWPHGQGQGWDRHYCWYKNVNGQHKGEYSIGPFQINLIEGCDGEGDKVHWERIPGDDIAEKIDWLSEPYNNVDYAYKLFTEWGGFSPWSGYTNGNFRSKL